MANRLSLDLQRAIRKANLTPADVARFAGVPPRWLESVMAGAQIRPGSKKLARLTDAIGVLGMQPAAPQAGHDLVPDPQLAHAERSGASAGELTAAAAAISAQTASLVTLARNITDLAESQARLEQTLTRFLAALNALLAVPGPSAPKGPPS
ncbi:MAG: hypothetical protein ACLQBX_19375 [Candidatus Limnocylindrales bacterium]